MGGEMHCISPPKTTKGPLAPLRTRKKRPAHAGGVACAGLWLWATGWAWGGLGFVAKAMALAKSGNGQTYRIPSPAFITAWRRGFRPCNTPNPKVRKSRRGWACAIDARFSASMPKTRATTSVWRLRW